MEARNDTLATNGTFIPGKPNLVFANLTELVIEAVFLAVLCLLGTTGNLLTLIATFKSRDLQSAYHLIQRCSMVVDLNICAFTLPFVLYSTVTDEWRLPSWLCSIFGVNQISMLAFTLSFHVLAALNRMCSCFPSSSICRKMITRKVVWVLILCFVGYDLAILSPLYIGYLQVDYVKGLGSCVISREDIYQKGEYFTSLIALVVYSSVILTGAIYAVILRRIYTMPRNRTNRRILKETSKNMFFLYLMFMVCWLPHAILAVMDPEMESPLWIFRVTFYFFFVYSALNPVIYVWRIPGYKEAVMKILGISPNRVALMQLVAAVPAARNPTNSTGTSPNVNQ